MLAMLLSTKKLDSNYVLGLSNINRNLADGVQTVLRSCYDAANVDKPNSNV